MLHPSVLLYSSDNSSFMLLLAGICLAIFLSSYFFSKKAIVKRALNSTPEKPFREFADGTSGKITGNIRLLGKTLKAPLSGRTCAYYHVLIEQYETYGHGGHYMTKHESEEAGDVIIEQNGAYAVIHTDLVKSYLVDDKKYTSGFLKDATPELKAFLKKHNLSSESLLGTNKSMRYREGILEAGEAVAVMGKGYWKSKDEFAFRIPNPKVLVIEPDSENPVYLSDDPETVK